MVDDLAALVPLVEQLLKLHSAAASGTRAAGVHPSASRQQEEQEAAQAALASFLLRYCTAHQCVRPNPFSAVTYWPLLVAAIGRGYPQLADVATSMLWRYQHRVPQDLAGLIGPACLALAALHRRELFDNRDGRCHQLVMQLLQHRNVAGVTEALAEQLGSSGLVQLLVQQLGQLDLEAGSSSEQRLARILSTLTPLRRCASLALHEAGALRALDALLLQVGDKACGGCSCWSSVLRLAPPCHTWTRGR